MDAEYRYQPLPPIPEYERSPPYTRLIWLAPGSGEDPLSAHLELINVEAAPRPYEALSYTWGTDPPCNYLWLQGYPLPIRPNLEAALMALRLPNLVRLLWIDAICIDQSNLDERARQVQYMRLVYKHAARVIVWVGLKTPGIEHAFEIAQRLMRLHEAGEEQARLGNSIEASSNELWGVFMDDMPRESMQRLYDLWHRPYFTRCWCIQEVAACSSALLKCEELEMAFQDLAGSIFAVSQWLPKLQQNTTLFLWWKIYDAHKKNSSMGPANVEGSLGNLLSIMDMTRPFQATDPRDKIFAMQGISDEGLNPILATTQVMGRETWFLRGVRRGFTRLAEGLNSLGPELDFGRPQALKPDYRKPVVDVYIDVTRFMIRKSPRVLDVLTHVMHTTNPEEGEYPSWVPKWFEPKTNQLMQGYFLAGFCKGHFRYFAEVHDNSVRSPAQFPRILSIDGFGVDTVHTIKIGRAHV